MTIFARILNHAARVGDAAATGYAQKRMATVTNTKGGRKKKAPCTPCEAMKRKAKARKWTGM